MLLSNSFQDFRPTAAVIDLPAFARNIRLICKHASVPLMGIVKADAYGHGAIACARILEQEHAAGVGVATAEEALELRQAGISIPVMVLGRTPPAAHTPLIQNSVICTIARPDDVTLLQAASGGQRVKAHIKIDSGMSRIGILPHELAHVLELLAASPNIDVEGLFTHFSSAETNPEYTKKQEAVFRDSVAVVQGRLPGSLLLHCCSSAAIHNTPSAYYSLVRPGIALYGGDLDGCTSFETEAVMQFQSSIVSVQHYAAGTPVSYGNTFVCHSSRRLGVLPVGYADGYPRALSNTGSVLVEGQLAPVVGRICMDMIMIDITDIPEASEGSQAILFGNRTKHGQLCPTVNDVATQAGTILYEILCGISKRVPRVYI